MSTLRPVEPAAAEDDPRVSILGVEITNVTRPRAIELLDQLRARGGECAGTVCFVNAHTLNLAAGDAAYRDVLNAADYVFGDGTGVRWAARLRRTPLRDNVNGTDLVPELLRAWAGRGYRYFLLGSDPETIDRAAQHVAGNVAGWEPGGHHHGYLTTPELTRHVIAQINAARPILLLIGMGNPLQERWLAAHRHELRVPLCLAVGGLFTYWAGDLHRAPFWLRRCGAEWLGILAQQPHKARRYLLGNPLFLARAVRDALVS